MVQVNKEILRQSLSKIGEKALIRDFIKPYFNAKDDPAGVGDDCAMVEFGACMDNTDGIGQSLSELSEASKCAFVVKQDALRIPGIVDKVCRTGGVRPLDIVFDGGADFSMVGTLRGEWTGERAKKRFGDDIEIIGFVAPREGVWLEAEARSRLSFRGWNYFLPQNKAVKKTRKASVPRNPALDGRWSVYQWHGVKRAVRESRKGFGEEGTGASPGNALSRPSSRLAVR
jgi:hypothetical protein